MKDKAKTKPTIPVWQRALPIWLVSLIVIASVLSTYLANQSVEFVIQTATVPVYGDDPRGDLSFIESLASPTVDLLLEEDAIAHATQIATSIDTRPMCTDFERDNIGQWVYRVATHVGYELFRIDEDGTNFCRLTDNLLHDDYPAWSPDGEQIAYISNNDEYGLYVMDADGTNIQLLNTGGTAYSYPQWSPNGQSIIFQATFDEVFDIYRLDLASGDVTNLTNQERLDNMAVYSPDGEFITFTSDRLFNPYINTNPLPQGRNYEIYMMNSDGTNARRLTVNSEVDSHPSFSPDNQQIVFQSDGNDIMLMNRDGSNPRLLTSGYEPFWLADGRIAYRSYDSDIYVINPDGTNEGMLMDMPFYGRLFDYTPAR